MNTRTKQPKRRTPKRVTRVIVGFAGTRRGDTLVEIAVTLARAVNANLKGIYVREKVLRDLAELPFSVASAPGLRAMHPLSAEIIENAWNREEAKYRRAISRHAGVDEIEWSFETASGSMESCLREIVSSGDIVALTAETGGPAAQPFLEGVPELAGIARAILLASPTQNQLQKGSILVIEKGGTESEDLVELAAQIATAMSRSLEVLSASPSAEFEAKHQSTDTSSPRFHWLDEVKGAALRQTVQKLAPSLIVTRLRSGSDKEDASIRSLIQKLKIPILLVDAPNQ